MIRCEVCKEREALKDERYCAHCRYALGCLEADMQAHMEVNPIVVEGSVLYGLGRAINNWTQEPDHPNCSSYFEPIDWRKISGPLTEQMLWDMYRRHLHIDWLDRDDD